MSKIKSPKKSKPRLLDILSESLHEGIAYAHGEKDFVPRHGICQIALRLMMQHKSKLCEPILVLASPCSPKSSLYFQKLNKDGNRDCDDPAWQPHDLFN